MTIIQLDKKHVIILISLQQFSILHNLYIYIKNLYI